MHLERWVIDEILDDEVRVLRSVLREESSQVPRVLRALDAEDDSTADERAAVRAVAIDVEAAPVDAWTPEAEVFVESRRLGSFLLSGARRAGRPGLPARERLREGDVYWIVEPASLAKAVAGFGQRDLGIDEGPGLVDAWEDAGAEVWDVTAASRQAVKRLVGQAQFAEPARQSMLGPESGG